jgi:hypothetical protein
MSADSTTIKAWIDSATEMVKDVPDALKETAFRAAFDALSSASGPISGTSRSTRGRKRASPATPRPPAPTRTVRRASGSGPKTSVAALAQEGYFQTPRRVGEIRDHLAQAKGRRFEPKAIATAVLRLLRDGLLRRERAADGEYEYSQA